MSQTVNKAIPQTNYKISYNSVIILNRHFFLCKKSTHFMYILWQIRKQFTQP